MASSSSSSNHNRKQHVGSKSMEMEDIVKHMSNLPSYLERGKPIQDRALNFGVLDWGRLERWQYHHKHGVIRTNKHSPSGSILSSEKKTTNQSRTKPRGSKKNDFPESRSSSSSSFSKGKMKLHDELSNEIGNLQDSRKQALFQMAVKNDRPLFTFAVDDKDNDIVAATVRNNLTGKDETDGWIYTFFTVHEVKKKKSGWLYHGTKDKDHGNYLPNVTAQMKVSNPSITNCKSTTREFVLSSVDSGQPDHQILDVQLGNELAAIVVRFPRNEDEEENQDCFSMTVILPGGHHSVPRKGEPSPLIQRWRSGGRCDCDGWDIGCRLRILANKIQSSRRSNPPQSFDLFLQGDVINKRPFFSLSPVKKGIFSVDYDSSLQLLHAFSICISVIECRKLSRCTELRTYVAKQVDDDVYDSLPHVGRVMLNI